METEIQKRLSQSRNISNHVAMTQNESVTYAGLFPNQNGILRACLGSEGWARQHVKLSQ